MKTGTVLSTMLAGAAACALSTAPALAAHAPNIHLTGIFKTPLKVTSGVNHFKTDMRNPKGVTHFTSTIDLSSAVSTAFSGLLYAYTWESHTSGGKCIQPSNQKQKYTKPAIGKVKGTTTVSENSCGTGDFTYYGPDFTNKKAQKGKANFTGTLTAKKYYGYDLLLNEDVTLTVG
jgi:hypothetical protein